MIWKISNKKIYLLIFVRGILVFVGFRNKLIYLIGPENYIFESSTNKLKIQTAKSELYCETIHILKEKNTL